MISPSSYMGNPCANPNLEKRLVILERQIENLSQHILELAKCDNFNSDLILDLRKRVETLEKGGE